MTREIWRAGGASPARSGEEPDPSREEGIAKRSGSFGSRVRLGRVGVPFGGLVASVIPRGVGARDARLSDDFRDGQPAKILEGLPAPARVAVQEIGVVAQELLDH